MQVSTDTALAQTLTLVDKRLALMLPATGQQVTARVTSVPTAGTVNLSINGASIQAQTMMALRSGESLQLQVAQVEPRVVLKVVPQAPGADRVQQALRTALPRQLPLVEIVANLKLLSQGNTTSATLPSQVQQAAQEIVANLPQASTLTSAEAVKQALLRAGPFLEAALLKSGPDLKQLPMSDFKAGLLNLRAVLSQALSELTLAARSTVSAPPANPAPTAPNSTPNASSNPAFRPAQVMAQGIAQGAQGTAQSTAQGITPGVTQDMPQIPGRPTAANSAPALPGGTPQGQQQPSLTTITATGEALGELLRQTEGAIARTELHQLVALADNDTARAAWSVELPIRDGEDVDVLQLLIERRPAGPGEQGEGEASVAVALNLEELGEVYAHLALCGGRLKVVFWAERESTVGNVRDNLDLLVERLERAGLSPEPISCHHGAPQKQPPPRRLQQLLDLMA